MAGGAVRKLDRAAMAPRELLALRGMIRGGGSGAVYGILRSGFGIWEALVVTGNGEGRGS